MTLKEILTIKAEEVFDLRSRGLLATLYVNAWEDVMVICKKHNDTITPTNINEFANSNNAVVRFWSQDGKSWEGSVRYKIGKVDAKVFKGCDYLDCERKVRGYIKNNTLKQVAYKEA